MDDRTPPEVEALVCDLYRRKETLGVIAEAAGVSVKTVYNILDRNGIPRRTRRQTDPLAVSPSECVTCRKAPPEKIQSFALGAGRWQRSNGSSSLGGCRVSWREWLETVKEKSLHDQMTADEMQTLVNGFTLLVEEHEAAGRMLGPECRGRESRAIADHDRKWQDVDVFLRGLGNG